LHLLSQPAVVLLQGAAKEMPSISVLQTIKKTQDACNHAADFATMHKPLHSPYQPSVMRVQWGSVLMRR